VLKCAINENPPLVACTDKRQHYEHSLRCQITVIARMLVRFRRTVVDTYKISRWGYS